MNVKSMQQNRTCICGAEFKPCTFLSRHCNNKKCLNLFMEKAYNERIKQRQSKSAASKI
jgi:hypothetical protein